MARTLLTMGGNTTLIEEANWSCYYYDNVKAYNGWQDGTDGVTIYYMTSGYNNDYNGPTMMTGDGAWLVKQLYTTARCVIFQADPQGIDTGGYYSLAFWWGRGTTGALSAGGANRNMIAVQTTASFTSTDEIIKLLQDANGDIAVIDSNGTTLTTLAQTTYFPTSYKPYHIELIFGTGSSDSWWIYVDGTLAGSGTTGNFSSGSPSANYICLGGGGTDVGDYSKNQSFASIVFCCGLSGNSDRVGADHYVMRPDFNYATSDTDYTNGLGSNPTTGGDTPSVGKAVDLYNFVGFEEASVKFNAPTASDKTTWFQFDGIVGGANDQLQGYYDSWCPVWHYSAVFEDPSAVWTNESSLQDMSVLSAMTCTTVGTSSSNYVHFAHQSFGYLKHHMDFTILGVAFYMDTGTTMTTSDYIGYAIYTNSLAETLLTGTLQSDGTATVQRHGPFWLTAPTGGWVWDSVSSRAIRDLEWRFWLSAGSIANIRRAHMAVVYQDNTPASFSSDVRMVQLAPVIYSEI